MNYDLYPKNAQEALARWDAGCSVFTIEMGGLGPGYEQAIHVGVFELLRRLGDNPDFPEGTDELNEMLDDELSAVCGEFDLGLSGAQAGAIKHLAYNYITRGWEETLNLIEEDRRIQVSKHWPGQKKESESGD